MAWKDNKKMDAANGRFGASGAVTRPKVCANFEVFAPVRALVEAPPVAKPLGRYVQGRAIVQRDNEVEK